MDRPISSISAFGGGCSRWLKLWSMGTRGRRAQLMLLARSVNKEDKPLTARRGTWMLAPEEVKKVVKLVDEPTVGFFQSPITQPQPEQQQQKQKWYPPSNPPSNPSSPLPHPRRPSLPPPPRTLNCHRFSPPHRRHLHLGSIPFPDVVREQKAPVSPYGAYGHWWPNGTLLVESHLPPSPALHTLFGFEILVYTFLHLPLSLIRTPQTPLSPLLISFGPSELRFRGGWPIAEDSMVRGRYKHGGRWRGKGGNIYILPIPVPKFFAPRDDQDAAEIEVTLVRVEYVEDESKADAA
ncbi:hypothetical protein BDK51DRAFT_27419 [Blyttiomyces helicus]|uniref:Uncharacterized protein n=1 Tax=Blyttiomyces helicus TaxID=388810 RepID=A0A4P9WDB4_9FUNG|nr:hypothetical protein BDK51DRAFT_27419 [Blyttiomyces helicus]|eukprot:RKO90671.1 hypothetical protein BDK51DRAFT_27419 [Blyttiomyces helicus]